MGSKPIPPYANIFMAYKIDKNIHKIAEKLKKQKQILLKLFKRFLDDLFFIFIGDTITFHTFIDEINTIHPNIKFTMTHTTPLSEMESPLCACDSRKSIPYLDTSCSIKNGKIVLDLYRKETDRNQYLLPSSCHPPSCTQNIPFSLATRINRICTETETRDIRLEEMRQMLLYRGYENNFIVSGIDKAKAIPRSVALRYKEKKKTKRPIFAINYDPKLPPVRDIQLRHWRSMVSQDPYLREVFPQPPLTAFKRPKNLRDNLIRAKIPQKGKTKPNRNLKGMKKCNNMCPACPFIREGKYISGTNFKWEIAKSVDCNTSNVVYMIQCKKNTCRKQYIGETEKKLKERFSQHKGYIFNQHLTQATGFHFNQPGHSLNDVEVTILEKVKKLDPSYRKEREKYLINKFNTHYKGINRQ